MPDISCPACGAGGRVPRNKMNLRLVCKKCLRVFHLTPGGQAVLGEPPAAKDAAKEKAVREPGFELRGPVDALLDKLATLKMPKVPPTTIGIVAGVVVVLGLGYLFLSAAVARETERGLGASPHDHRHEDRNGLQRTRDGDGYDHVVQQYL